MTTTHLDGEIRDGRHLMPVQFGLFGQDDDE